MPFVVQSLPDKEDTIHYGHDCVEDKIYDSPTQTNFWCGQWDGLGHRLEFSFNPYEVTCEPCLTYAIQEGDECRKRLEQLHSR